MLESTYMYETLRCQHYISRYIEWQICGVYLLEEVLNNPVEDSNSWNLLVLYNIKLNVPWPASMTQSEWMVIRKSRVRSQLGPATFSRRDWWWNIFYGRSLPSAFSRMAVVSFWRNNVANYWLTAKRTKLPQEKYGEVKWPARHDPNGLTGP